MSRRTQILLAVLFIVGILAMVSVVYTPTTVPAQPKAATEIYIPSQTPTTHTSVYIPPTVYRHSLIPGGVKTIAELEARVSADPKLQAIYAGFDFGVARFCSVPKGQYFISYRIGDSVKWTARQGGLNGEICITDGQHTLLTRCGNLISLIPMEPSGSEWPNDLAMPEIPVSFLPDVPAGPTGSVPVTAPLPPATVPQPVDGPRTIGQIYYPPVVVIPIIPISGQPPVKVPEPSALQLVFAGAMVFVAFKVLQPIWKREAK